MSPYRGTIILAKPLSPSKPKKILDKIHPLPYNETQQLDEKQVHII
jgi:hypothetical protein